MSPETGYGFDLQDNDWVRVRQLFQMIGSSLRLGPTSTPRFVGLTSEGDLMPATDNAYAIGETTTPLRWKNIECAGSGRFDGGVGIGIDPLGNTQFYISKTLSSPAKVRATLVNLGTGNTMLHLYAGSDWVIGINNADGDKLIIAQSDVPTSNIRLSVTTAGAFDFQSGTIACGAITGGTYNGLTISTAGNWSYLTGAGAIGNGLDIAIPNASGNHFFYGEGGTEHHKFGNSGQVEISDDGIITAVTINAFSLGGKLTGGANEIEGSAFDINGGTMDGVAIAADCTQTEWDAAYTHVSNNGTDHSYIDQDLQTTASPAFAGISIPTINDNTDQDLDLWKNLVVGDRADGKTLYVHRNASEGVGYYKVWVDQDDKTQMESTGNFEVTAGSIFRFTGGDEMFFITGSGNNIHLTFGGMLYLEDIDAAAVVRAILDSSNGWLALGTASAPTVALDVTGAAKISTSLAVDTTTLVVDDVNDRVGIGTANPGTMLEIQSSSPVLRLRDTGAIADATAAFVEFGGTEETAWSRTGYVGDASSGDSDIYLEATVGDLHLGDSSGHSVLNLNGGNVGIGLTTVNANYKLIIRRAANVNLGIGLQSSELAIAAFNDALSANIPMRFYASEFNLLNGNVGINETTPQDKLEVNGTVLVKDKLKFTQDDGNEYIDSLADGYMDYRATTAHRFGDGTNQALISSAGVVTLEGTATVEKSETFTFNYRNITAQGKPTLVNQGVFFGFSLPVYNNDDEELFACRCMDGDWDGTTDPVIYVGGWLDTANDTKKFQLQVSVETVDYAANDVVLVTTNDYNTETTTGTWAQYTSFKAAFTIDASAIGLVAAQPLAIRVRRIAATADEIAGEVVVEGAVINYTANKLGA